MTTSEQINEIATALAKAQGEIAGAVKDSANPFFKSSYADLASVWEACRAPLSKNGIAIVQSPSAEGACVTVETLMVHTSGQWVRNSLHVSAKDDSPQAIGSAITYLRRYVLQSLAGVAPTEDDGEAAHGRPNGQQKAHSAPVVPMPPKGYQDWLDDMAAVVDEGTDKLSAAWKNSKSEYRTYLTGTAPKQWEAMKARAATMHEQVAQ